MAANEISYRITVDDTIAVWEYFARHTPEGQPRPRAAGWLWIGVLLLLGVVMFLGTNSPEGPQARAQVPGWWFAILGAPVLLCLALVIFFSPGPVRRYLLRRSLLKSLSSAALELQTFRVMPDSFTITDGKSTTTSCWETIQHVALTEDRAFLVTTANNAYVLPKRAFADEDDFLDFIAEIKRYRARQMNADHQPD